MRRFSDFLGLHDLLVNKYIRLGRIVPPAPEKNLIGMFESNKSFYNLYEKNPFRLNEL